MNFEQRINKILLSHPKIKKIIKSTYQHIMVFISKKFTSEGNITRISPEDSENDYFFGYYDKSPWDATGRYILCLKVKDASKEVAPKEEAEILLIDTQNKNIAKCIAKTKTWNVQQGCMMQWLGPEFNKKIIYNDFRNGKYCSIILNVFTGEEKQIDYPIYAVANNGKFALSLDFSRLHRLRPGYGYSNIEEKNKNFKVPQNNCISYIDLENNSQKEIISFDELIALKHRKDMENAEHKVNHIMINPNNNRIMFIHRWFIGNKKISRLVTADVSGNNLFVLSDDDMVSHCFWKNETEIFGFLSKKEFGNGYYLLKDRTNQFVKMFPDISNDGHPSYSPDKEKILTDTYPNRKRISTIKILNEKENKEVDIIKVFSSFKYDNDTRCDLHPRWSRDGKKICFDATFEGKRKLYISDL